MKVYLDKLDKLLHVFIFYVLSWFDKNKGLLLYLAFEEGGAPEHTHRTPIA